MNTITKKIGIGIGLAAIGVGAVVLSGGSLLPAVVGATKIIGVCATVAVTYQIADNIISTIYSGGDYNDVKQNVLNDVDDAFATGVLSGGGIVATMGVGEYYLSNVADDGFKIFGGRVEGMYTYKHNTGGTLLKIDNFNRFHLDLDAENGLHYHVGKTKSQRKVHHVIIKWVFGKIEK